MSIRPQQTFGVQSCESLSQLYSAFRTTVAQREVVTHVSKGQLRTCDHALSAHVR